MLGDEKIIGLEVKKSLEGTEINPRAYDNYIPAHTLVYKPHLKLWSLFDAFQVYLHVHITLV